MNYYFFLNLNVALTFSCCDRRFTSRSTNSLRLLLFCFVDFEILEHIWNKRQMQLSYHFIYSFSYDSDDISQPCTFPFTESVIILCLIEECPEESTQQFPRDKKHTGEHHMKACVSSGGERAHTVS